MFVKPKSQTVHYEKAEINSKHECLSESMTDPCLVMMDCRNCRWQISFLFSQKLETPKNETQQERVQKFDGDLDKDRVERAKLSLPQAMKDHAHGDKEVVQGKIVVIRLLIHHWIWTIRRCIFKVTQAVCETFFNQVSMKKMKMKMMMQLGGC
ncbi:hypothetical protein QL285_021602 [Trifolium repens]|nr:hypothetical protein QL285_021602 [Trifolium repens]